MIAAVYARKSTDQSGVSDDQKSVARQLDHARQYAERKGWTVADEYVFVDDGISGAEFANRPGFLRQRSAIVARRPLQNAGRVQRELLEMAQSWRRVLADDPTHARPIVAGMLKDRASFTPIDRGRWEMKGTGHLDGLFSRVFSTGDGVVGPTFGNAGEKRNLMFTCISAGPVAYPRSAPFLASMSVDVKVDVN